MLMPSNSLSPLLAVAVPTFLYRIPWIPISLLAFLALTCLLIAVLVRANATIRRLRGDATIAGAPALKVYTLERLWQRFLARLPKGARPAVLRYPSVIVMGPVGGGKSQVIRSFIDWQGQSNQFLPSLTDSPLVQIYLGGRILVEELGAQLLNNNSTTAQGALERLWKPLCRERAPLCLIVLNFVTLESMAVADRVEMAHRLRGKLALLGRLVGAPVEVRISLTRLDQVRGFVEFARFCATHRIPVTLPLQGISHPKELTPAIDEFSKYLPLALAKLSSAEFCEVVAFLHEIPRIVQSLDGFLKPLTEWSVASQPPSLERLYFYSSQPGASGNSPFVARRFIAATAWASRVRSLLPSFVRSAPWHLLAALAVVALAATICVLSAQRHAQALENAENAVENLAQVVHRAQATLGDVRESPAVRAAGHEARDALETLQIIERSWALHRILYRGTKRILTLRFLETIRTAYFLPLLASFGANRDIECTLYTLAVIYAARDSALGSVVSSELRDISQALNVSEAVITDYVQLSDKPWKSGAAVPWSRLVSGNIPPAHQTATWLHFFRQLQQIYRQQGVTTEQLRRLQTEATPLMRIADAVRTKRKLAQILNCIAEESPLVEIESNVGRRHMELLPPQWLRDQQGAISAVLHLVHDTDQNAVKAGQLSLVQVLRLLTDLDDRKHGDDVVYSFEIDEETFSFSSHVWQDMLLRGRNQLVLGALYKSGESGASADAPSRRHHRRHRHRDSEPAGEIAEQRRPAHRRHGRHGRRELDDALPKLRRDESLLPEGGQYTRASYEQDMRKLLQKLDKALGDDSGLPAPQKQYLTNYVQAEAKRYAARYCAALVAQHKSYVFPGGELGSTRASLIELLAPSGSLLVHLKSVADNANLTGLDGRFMQPIAACLTQFKPLLMLMTPDKEGGYPGLKPYAGIVGAVVKDLDTGKPAEVKEDGKMPALGDLLSPVGRLGLAVLTEKESSPERKVEQFLEVAGLGGPLAPPFLAPTRHVTRLGIAEIERVVAAQWEMTLQPAVRPLLARYPFDLKSDRELQPTELDILRPTDGTFWLTVRQLLGPVALEQNGEWTARKWERGAISLPKGMLPLLSQLNKLSAALFTRDGARRPLDVVLKPLPVQVCDAQNPAALSFLAVGKARVFGVNGTPTSVVLEVPWWQQEVAAVGLEFPGKLGQRRGLSIEVADSPWSFFRLLEKSTSPARNLRSFALPSEGAQTCEVRFELEKDPAAIFHIRPR